MTPIAAAAGLSLANDNPPAPAPSTLRLPPFPRPRPGECFRAFICRAVNKTAPPAARKQLQRDLLAHFRSAGLDVNAPARKCLEAINLFNSGAQ